jgi:hypothetical protein
MLKEGREEYFNEGIGCIFLRHGYAWNGMHRRHSRLDRAVKRTRWSRLAIHRVVACYCRHPCHPTSWSCQRKTQKADVHPSTWREPLRGVYVRRNGRICVHRLHSRMAFHLYVFEHVLSSGHFERMLAYKFGTGMVFGRCECECAV